jgi:hypothetical protein
MLVPGPWRGLEELTAALRARGIDAKAEASGPVQLAEVGVRLVQDEHLDRAFAWGRRGALDPQLVSCIAHCKFAAVVEVGYRLSENAVEVARIGRALRDAGGLAVRMEASGGASSWETWLESLESGDASSIYESAVTLVSGDEGEVFTCGMHLFDMPDAAIVMNEVAEAIAWLDTFCVYQIKENPALASGHTFRPDADAERRVLERWPDSHHDSSDGRYNPFGIWQLKAPEEARVKATKLALTFIPTLSVILTAAERAKGGALARSEVEQIVSEGSVIAMEHCDASALERSRGYADIEPELAWEQWQIVRGAAS